MQLRLLHNNQKEKQEEEAIFRSATMALVQFYVTIELARDVVFAVGSLGDVHFRDLNSKLTPFQRTFVQELRNIDSIETQLKYMGEVMEKHSIHVNDIPLGGYKTLPSISEMDDIRDSIKKFYERTHQLEESYNKLEEQKQNYIDNRHVVNAINDFHKSSLLGIDDANIDANDDEVGLLNERNNNLESGLESVDLSESGFNSIAGTIVSDKIPLLRKILWRTLRGNLFFHDIPINSSTNKTSKEEVAHKSVFIIYIHGDVLKARVRRIIQSLDGVIFDNIEGGASVRMEMLKELNDKISDLNTVVENTKDHLISELIIFQDSFAKYSYVVQQEKLMYQTLNKFDEDSTRRCLVGEGWVPKADIAKIRSTLKSLLRQKTRFNGPHSNSQESINLTDTESADQASLPYSPSQNETLFRLDDIDEPLIEDNDESDSLIAVVNELSTNRVPPTYHKTNKFTSAFQLIIDAYGTATYQEVNPGLASIITFPFMFAIMFGDVGHGFIVLLIALYLIRNENIFGPMKNKDEIFEMAFNGRYIILLMGVFSVYTGLIYNDVFSKSMSIFSSGWEWKFPEGYSFEKDGPISLVAEKVAGYTYPFGLDWSWHGTENNLLFTNSYKMKLSILMGFAHMNYSLFFSLVNYRFFKSKVDIIGNFIPGFLFMQSIFGYLAITIIYKWSVDWLGKEKQPPGLLNMLINMFLSPGTIEEQLYPGQKFVQIILVLIALICVPWLLLYKPLTLKKQNSKAVQLGYTDLHSQMDHHLQILEEEEALDELQLNNDPRDSVDFLDGEFRFPNDIEPLHNNSGSHGDADGHFNFGDIVIHQVIHTIEFCLNCVSHTASYLRLWALSLAHAQLSSVLWTMTIQNAFGTTGTKGVFMTVFLFGLWFVLTVCILVLMEGTSAMLHSLRLHWVEAMSKFFEGEGYAYEPFTFEDIELLS